MSVPCNVGAASFCERMPCFCTLSAASAGGALRGTWPRLLPVKLNIASFSPPTRRRRPNRRIVASTGSVPERIAVIGGGLAGLATAYHLLHSTYRVANKRGVDYQTIRVTVFDPAEPGTSEGASSVAAGLLHPFTPRVKKYAWMADKGMRAALSLIEAAQPFSPTPLVKTPGIIRYALTDKQRADFSQAKRRFMPELDLLSVTRMATLLPDARPNTRGIKYRQGSVVNTPAYLHALWAACDATGRVSWRRERIDAFESLFTEFDSVIVCAGAATRTVSNLASLPINPCRGQNIRYRPRVAPPPPLSESLVPPASGDVEDGENNEAPAVLRDKHDLPEYPVIAGKYLIPDLFNESGTMLAGATFEYFGRGDHDGKDPLHFASGTAPPDLDYAVSELTEPLSQLSPSLSEHWIPESSQSGVRALPPRSMLGSVPIAGEIKGVPQHDKAAWILTALGSRGLLHHALLGKLVARSAIGGSDVLIPIDARRIPLKYEELAGSCMLTSKVEDDDVADFVEEIARAAEAAP
jgi:glycine/D-amino acid oxidase-like deaminating enzyme